jgi:DNA modification methylase
VSSVELRLGNCLDVMSGMPDNIIDLTVTSPPYDNLRSYNGYVFDFEPIAKELFRITKPGGVLVWIVGDATIDGSESGSSFTQALYFKSIGFNLHDTMIYEKNGPSYPSKNKYYQIFEYMFILSKGSPITFNPIRDRKNRWYGQKWSKGRTRRDKDGNLKWQDWYKDEGTEFGTRFNIWKFNTGAGYTAEEKYAYDHPAMFPEALARDHILSWSNPNDIVLDPLLGSGTTGKMAVKHDRNFIGIEIDPTYFAIAKRRIKEASQQLRLWSSQ